MSSFIFYGFITDWEQTEVEAEQLKWPQDRELGFLLLNNELAVTVSLTVVANTGNSVKLNPMMFDGSVERWAHEYRHILDHFRMVNEIPIPKDGYGWYLVNTRS